MRRIAREATPTGAYPSLIHATRVYFGWPAVAPGRGLMWESRAETLGGTHATRSSDVLSQSSERSRGRPFEFVLVDSPGLAALRAAPRAFQGHFGIE